ncbi:MAG: NAD(P)/FAD-dependent oxidoreductase [Pirellulaceae bacterium]|nr:NAD(P)/FAD-dependent oxidoreductase [Pirellulaceae bacterium]
MYDTIVIGAGMSGLAAGIRLAHYDQKVCILEKHSTVGGLNSFYRLRGRNYDVGLHAMTNFTPKGAKKGPLARLLRQLRIKWDEFALAEQVESAIRFPDVDLYFNNDFDFFVSEVEKNFPHQREAFQKLLSKIIEYDHLSQSDFEVSTRKVLSETLTDPLLVEMLLCPLMWYGNAREHDMDFGQFCIMFRSIYMEGLSRPLAGVRLILKKLVKRFRTLGGMLRLHTGVEKILIKNGKTSGVLLENGEILEAKKVVSSAGWAETMKMCQEGPAIPKQEVGQLSFIETISTLDCLPADFDYRHTIVFYNDSEKFDWRVPADQLCDVRTGVICSPNNFSYSDNQNLSDGIIRITSLANFDKWRNLSKEEYQLAKARWYDENTASAARFMPDFRKHIIDTDMFTPTTIERFTWHRNGAIYGAPKKQFDGTTHLNNLFVCGTDQGFVGIVGAIISGISIANQHLLR